METRLESILHYKKPTFWLAAAAVLTCAAAAVFFLTDPLPSRSFLPMDGKNISDLEPRSIVDGILELEGLDDNAGLYVNGDNMELICDDRFDWENAGAVRFFYYEDGKTKAAQLRLFWDEGTYFMTEPNEWPEQHWAYLLEHYLEAVKYLPVEQLRQLSPEADQYMIQLKNGGDPSGYEQMICYDKQGVTEADGWTIHLEVLPFRQETASGNSAQAFPARDTIHLFYDAELKR